MRLRATVGAFVLCAKLLAQVPPALTTWLDTAPPSEKFPAEWYSARTQDTYHPTANGGTWPSPLVGIPFTGTIVMSAPNSQPGQGPRFSREFTMRDSKGRTRIEDVADVDGMPAAIASQIKSRITVNDVVSHCSFDWVEPATNEADKIAIVQCGPHTVTLQPTVDGMEIKMTKQVVETTHPFPWQTLQIEPLGEKVVAGVKAVGIRQTLTDMHSSSGRPQVTEIWWSPEIKEMLEAKPLGDAEGRFTIEMTEIKRDEPDPAQFYPPEGYKIVPGALPF